MFSTEQRVNIVKWYFETKSIASVQTRFCTEYGVHPRNKPSKPAIWKLVKKFKSEGTILNINKGRSGRPRSVRCEGNMERVRESVMQSPKKSHRQRSAELGLTPSSIRRIMKQDLNLFPFHITTAHKLTDGDKAARVAMYEMLQQKMEENPN